MQFVDTHCHLYDEAFDGDRDEVLQRALDAGVTTLLLPAIDSQSHERQELLAAQHPECFRQMMGLHPTSVKEDFEQELDIIHDKLFHSHNSPTEYVAVGEIGLDFYWDTTYLEQQRELLLHQMQWAEELQLPVCLHVRKAYNELFGLLKRLNRPRYRGVMHCFGGSLQEAYKAIEMGFYLGVGGVATFKNAALGTIAATVPLESLVLETDAPYLSPVPHRGQRNEPAYIPLIAQKIADLRSITLGEVADITTASAKSLFNL
jgi:TatD DNase family protein